MPRRIQGTGDVDTAGTGATPWLASDLRTFPPIKTLLAAPSFTLSGRRALVTGSSQGIGYALARALAASGAHVLLNGRDPAKLDRAIADFQAAGLSAEAHAFDVTEEAAVQAAAPALGVIDILVNNTGIQRRGPLATMP